MVKHKKPIQRRAPSLDEGLEGLGWAPKPPLVRLLEAKPQKRPILD